MSTENERAREWQRKKRRQAAAKRARQDALRGDNDARARLERGMLPVTRMSTEEAIRRGL